MCESVDWSRFLKLKTIHVYDEQTVSEYYRNELKKYRDLWYWLPLNFTLNYSIIDSLQVITYTHNMFYVSFFSCISTCDHRNVDP